MRVTIFGSGYVGLVTGACLADAGNHVMCVDVDAGKIERLKRGEVPIHEPGLEALIKRNAEAGRIEFTTDAVRGVEHGLFQLIAVGTPPGEDGSADLRYVLAVARTIGTHLGRYSIVITKSTVPVGTADKVRAELARTLDERGVKIEFDVVSNPEFLKEGRGDRRLQEARPRRRRRPTTRGSASCCATLYAPFLRTDDRLIVMDARSRRDDQVRRQRHAGHQDQLHQRDGQPLRARTAPTSRRSAAASATTRGSASASSSPASATAARASRRTCRRSIRSAHEARPPAR